MSVMTFDLLGGHAPCSMKLNLDPQFRNEKTILGFVTKGRYLEPDVSEIFLKVLRPGDVVIDVGGNIGFFSVLAGVLVGPGGRVIAYEPDPANRARLEANLALNDLGHVMIVPNPLSSASGTVDFFINSDDSGGNALWDPAQYPGNVRSQAEPKILKLQTTTLDAEVKRLGLACPKLIKVDTEGADQRVLEGAARLLRDRAVPFIVSELHEFGLAKMGCSQATFRNFMEGLGYSTYALYHSGNMPRFIPAGTRVRGKYILNVLFSTPESISQYWPEIMFDPSTG